MSEEIDHPVGVFGDREAAEAFSPTLEKEGIEHRWEENHHSRMVLMTKSSDAKRAEAIMYRYLGVDERGRRKADRMGSRFGCLVSLVVWVLLIAILSGCAHTVRREGLSFREEFEGEEIITVIRPLIFNGVTTPQNLFITAEREVYVEQDVRIITIAEERVTDWSPMALVQFLGMSWNPIAWAFPGLWHESDHADHGIFVDWLQLWNPFVRTGGGAATSLRSRDVDANIERRNAGVQRLPLNQTEIGIVLRAGGMVENIRRTTDNTGRITIPFSTLPRAMRQSRPLVIEGTIDGLGRVEAQVW